MEKALKLLEKFNKLGYQAYLVGGSVRDYLLKRDSFDFDIATDCLPEEVMKLFKGIPIGIKFGTVLVKFEKEEFEVTTFRKDLGYYDNRHPEGVVYTNDIHEDVLRRDYTINGMYLDKNLTLIDLVNGQKDLDLKIVRTIGNPNERFNEDALRMLRAFYLVSKLDFDIDKNTFNSIKKNVKLINNVSAERIYKELSKIFAHNNKLKALKLMKETNLHKELPGLEKGIDFIVNNNSEIDFNMFLSLSFYLNNEIDSFWKLSNEVKIIINNVIKILNLENLNELSIYKLRREDLALALDINELIKVFDESKSVVINRYDNILIYNDSQLDISNKELITYTSLEPGPWITKLKEELVELVIKKELKNNKDEILKYIKRIDIK